MDLAHPVEQTRTPAAEGGYIIGASDAAAILGQDRYNPPIAVWRRLRGLDPAERELPEGVREAGEWGQALEPVVRGRYASKERRGVFVPTESIIHPTLPWLRCTPDGLSAPLIDTDAGPFVADFTDADASRVFAARSIGAIGHVQVKTASAWLADEWDDRHPAKYEIQCRVEMAVTGLPWCDLVCLIGGQRYVCRRIHRDEAIEATIIADLADFMSLVMAGREPMVDASDEWAAHAGSKMAKTDATMAPGPQERDALAEWKRARLTRKRAEETEAHAKTTLLLAMSAAGATRIDTGDGIVTAYQTGGRTDWKGYAASLSKAPPPAQFVKPSTTWALKVPKSWGDAE